MRIVLLTAAVLIAGAAVALAGSRPAPSTADEIGYSGSFRGPASGSSKFVAIRVAPDGTKVWDVQGDLPARCTGGVVTEKGIFVQPPRGPFALRPDGRFDIRRSYSDGGIRITVRITGTFAGRRVTGVAGARERNPGGLVCTGKRRFTARRTAG